MPDFKTCNTCHRILLMGTRNKLAFMCGCVRHKGNYDILTSITKWQK